MRSTSGVRLAVTLPGAQPGSRFTENSGPSAPPRPSSCIGSALNEFSGPPSVILFAVGTSRVWLALDERAVFVPGSGRDRYFKEMRSELMVHEPFLAFQEGTWKQDLVNGCPSSDDNNPTPGLAFCVGIYTKVERSTEAILIRIGTAALVWMVTDPKQHLRRPGPSQNSGDSRTPCSRSHPVRTFRNLWPRNRGPAAGHAASTPQDPAKRFCSAHRSRRRPLPERANCKLSGRQPKTFRFRVSHSC